MELDERLRSRHRGVHTASTVAMATVAGHAASAGPMPARSRGKRADLMTIRSLGAHRRGAAGSAVEAAVFAGLGRRRHRRHRRRAHRRRRRAHHSLDVAAELARDHHGSVRRVTDQPVARALVVDNIGSLVTNDPALGRGPLGIVDAPAS